MARVLGIGGVFIRSKDPKALIAWYERHLGIKAAEGFGGFLFDWNGTSTLSIFPADTDNFRSRDAQFMLNLAVDDVHGLVAKMRAGGVEVEEKVEDSEFGVFAWVKDPEGRTIELYQPKG